MKEILKENIDGVSYLTLNQINRLKTKYKLAPEIILVLENCRDVIEALLEIKKDDKELIDTLIRESDDGNDNYLT